MAKIANGSCTPIRKYLRANLRTNRRDAASDFRPTALPHPIWPATILLVGSGPVLAAVVELKWTPDLGPGIAEIKV
jgi:hypothetical protein